MDESFRPGDRVKLCTDGINSRAVILVSHSTIGITVRWGDGGVVFYPWSAVHAVSKAAA